MKKKFVNMELDKITLKSFRELPELERKRFNRDQLITILLNAEISDMADLTTAIKNLSQMVTEFKNQQEADSQKIVELNTSVQLLKDENSKLRREFSQRINNLEQRTRINNIEIVGLKKPSLMETDAAIAIDFLNTQVGVEVDQSDIEALHEVPSKRKDEKRIVIVHFKSRNKRDIILSTSKERMRELNKNIDVNKRVYVNEHLSPLNKKLFAMATKKKYEFGYKFIWSKNGVIFFKKK